MYTYIYIYIYIYVYIYIYIYIYIHIFTQDEFLKRNVIEKIDTCLLLLTNSLFEMIDANNNG